MDALLAGEIMRLVVERRARIAFLDRQTEPTAERLPSPHATLHPWLFTFSDAKLEDEFLNEQFLRSHTVNVVAFALMIAFLCVASVFAIAPFHYISTATVIAMLCAREYGRRQHAACGHVIFGRGVIAALTLGYAAVWAYTRTCFAALATEKMIYFLVIPAVFFSASLHCVGIGYQHRLGALAVCTLGFLSLGDLSALGQSAESTLLIFGLLLGQLMGFTFESHVRRIYLSNLGLREAKTRAERGQQEAKAERRIAQDQNAKQSDLLDRIFATSHGALMLCELPAAPEQPPTLLRCSPNTHSILGVPADADPFTAAFTAEQQRAIGADVELLAAQRFFPERIQTLAHSGTSLACSGHMVDDTRFLVTMRDVTEAKRTEQRERHVEMQRIQSAAQRAIEEAKAACDTLQKLDLASDLVTHMEIKNGTTTLLYCSASYEAVLGHQPKTCVGNVDGLTHLYPPSFLASQPRERAAAFESRRIADGSTMETPLLHADGHEIWFEERVKIDPADPNKLLLVSRDITDRRERHRLEVENARLEVARQKDEEAMHMLAHELKNRFIGVRGHVENARLTVEEKAGHLLQAPHNLQEAFADATAAVDRGLFLCMNRAVTLQLVHGAYEPRSMDLDVAKELLVASAKRCDVHVDAGVPRVVRLDSNLLLFVAENFIANAQNYGPVGRGDDKSITLRASCEGARLRIVVTNNPGPRHADARREYGDGDATARILDKGGLQKSATSTGHGLRIVKRCVDMLRGSTSLRFLANRVEASLSVPFAVVEHGKKVDLPPGLRIAAVDDADYIRQMDADCFASLGVDAVLRGATADEIATFPAFVARMRPPPQVVLLDENLDDPQTLRPFVKGTDLIARLREGGYENKVVIRSANQASADRARYRACGADASLDKGLSQEAFARELASILDGTWTWSGVDASKLSDGGLSAQHASEFAKRVPPYLEEARRRADAADVDGAWAVVHQVKALALMLGAKEVASACEALRSGWTAPLFERVETEAREVLSALSANGERTAGERTAGAEAQPLLRAGSLASGDSFRARSQVFIDELRQALARGAPCDGILHQLSGCSSMAGASRLAHFAQRAEKSAEPFGDDQRDQLESIWRATLDAAGLPAPQPSEAGRHRS